MPYVPKDWSDGPAGGTPITAAELERMEGQYAAAMSDVAAGVGADLTELEATVAGVQGDVADLETLTETGRLSEDELSATFDAGDAKRIYVSPTGDDARFSGLTPSAPKRTIAAALAAMGAGVKGTIVLGHGDIDAGTGVVWYGYQCSMIGQGSANTRVVTTAQAGPILDLTVEKYTLNDTTWGGFTLYGDGVSNPANKGLLLDSAWSIVNAAFHDIVVRNTGGTAYDLGIAELCIFDQLYAFEPISAVSDDEPYISARGAFNGNTFHDCVLHGLSAAASVGVSGAIVIADNGTTAPHANNFDTFKFEFLHVPDSGTILSLAGNDTEINHTQVFDCSKVAGATGTSYFRFVAPAVMNSGGNKLFGVIPGKGTNATDIDMGVDLRQSRNAVVGVKGYRGTNVVVAVGVANSYVELHGAVGAASDPAIIDNSGVVTNILVDRYLNVEKRPARTIVQGATSLLVDIPGGAWGQGGVRFSDPATPANGVMGMGSGGTRIRAIGVGGYAVADSWTFQSIALANLFGVMSSGVKGIRLYDSGALPPAAVAYRGVIAYVLAPAGTADRLVFCRKDAADAYAWVDLF